jgi:hypothetical protein
VPSINNGHYNKSGYTWNNFLSEFELMFIELAYACSRNGKETIILELVNLQKISS